MTPEDSLELCRKIRYDLTAAQAKLTNIIEALASLPPTPKSVCCICGLHLRGPLSLAEHLYTSHDGDLPDHWAQAERLAGSAS